MEAILTPSRKIRNTHLCFFLDYCYILIFSQVSIHICILQNFQFLPPKNESLAQKNHKHNSNFHYFETFSVILSSFSSLTVTDCELQQS